MGSGSSGPSHGGTQPAGEAPEYPAPTGAFGAGDQGGAPGEEGLGDLRGMRAVLERFSSDPLAC